MTITLNGEKREVPDGLTVLGLLQHLDIRPERVAVERNLEIVRKSAYAETAVRDGDSVEVVQFMGGGAGQRECKVQSAEQKQEGKQKVAAGFSLREYCA